MTQALALDPRKQHRVDQLVRKARKLGDILHEIYELTGHPALVEAARREIAEASYDTTHTR